MPQLIPEPWFAIFIMSWTAYLLILMPKVNNLKSLNKPVFAESFKNKPQPWNWPWT
uniref:ATP synthase complex subunit 8 n=1 Tax=Cryptobranchus alleganiensis TaxID=43048 RepID=C9DHK3_CRYAE|nr:ATP synthase F0 subunit 8 [Cryptobranchus alleganiensis]